MKVVIASGRTVGLAEGIIDDTCLVAKSLFLFLASQLLSLVLVGILRYAAQLVMIKCLHRMEGGSYSLLVKCLTVIFGFSVDIFYFGIVPDELGSIGIALILVTVIGSILFPKQNVIGNNNEQKKKNWFDKFKIPFLSAYKRIK